jgi:AcrR family transcriptional regulator
MMNKEKMGMNTGTADTPKPRETRRAQAERSETMQRRLLDAAMALLKERGLVGLRTADVAELAGVSKGALLHHYPTKTSLVVAVFNRLYEAASDSSKAFHPTSTLAETISNLITDSHGFFFGESFYITLDITLGAGRDPELRTAVFDVVRLFRKRTEDAWIERLAAYGVPPERAHDAVWLVNSAVRGLAVRALWEPDQPLFERLERITAAIITEHFSKPEGEAQTAK